MVKRWITYTGLQRWQEFPCSSVKRREVINTQLRTHTAFYSTITIFFFLSSNIWFCPKRSWASEILHLHIQEALNYIHFQKILDRGESSEAGVRSVLRFCYTSSIALLVIFHAEGINPNKQIFLTLASKTKHPPPSKQIYWTTHVSLLNR